MMMGLKNRPLHSFISVHQLFQQYGVFVQILQIFQLFAKLSSVKSQVFSTAAFLNTVDLERSFLFGTLAALQISLSKNHQFLKNKAKQYDICEIALFLMITLIIELRPNCSDFFQRKESQRFDWLFADCRRGRKNSACQMLSRNQNKKFQNETSISS